MVEGASPQKSATKSVKSADDVEFEDKDFMNPRILLKLNNQTVKENIAQC